MGRPGVLLDRDGTIIVDAGYVGTVAEVALIDGAAGAIAAFNAAGLPVPVVTNQSGVAPGYFVLDEVNTVNERRKALPAAQGAHVDAIWTSHTLVDTSEVTIELSGGDDE